MLRDHAQKLAIRALAMQIALSVDKTEHLGEVYEFVLNELRQIFTSNGIEAPDVQQGKPRAVYSYAENPDQLLRVLRHVARSFLRDVIKRERTRTQRCVGSGASLEVLTSPRALPDDLAAVREGLDDALLVLDEFDPRYREVIALRLRDGLTAEEAGARLGESADNVRKLQSRALQILKEARRIG